MFKFFKSLFKRERMTRREENVRRAIAYGEGLNFVHRAYNLTDEELYLFTR